MNVLDFVRWTRGSCATGLAVILMTAGAAHAGTITMDVKCIFTGSNVIMQVLNKGDEAAQNVFGRIDFNGHVFESPTIQSLAPQEPRSTPMVLPLEGLRGTYAAVVTVRFEDLNGHPFSTVSVLPIPTVDAKPADVQGALDMPTTRKNADLTLRLRSDVATPLTVRYRLVAPRERMAEQPAGETVVPARGTVAVVIPVENVTATPDRYDGVHAVIEYDADGRHFATVASANVLVTPGGPGCSRRRFPWYFWVCVVGGIVVMTLSFVIKPKPKA